MAGKHDDDCDKGLSQSADGALDNINSDQEQEDMMQDDENITHLVTFKCIGTTKEPRYQEVLAESVLKKRNGEEVQFRIQPEPRNVFDTRAIAIECFTGTQWERVGYSVHTVLDSVHQTLQHNNIVSVELKWVKFITHWTRSCPGWYCGIEITRKGGLWSEVVLRC